MSGLSSTCGAKRILSDKLEGRHPSYGCYNITSFSVCLGRFSMMLICGHLMLLFVVIDGGNALFFTVNIYCLAGSTDAVCV